MATKTKTTKRKVNFTNRVRDYLKENPDADNDAVIRSTGVERQYLYNIRSILRKRAQKKPKTNGQLSASADVCHQAGTIEKEIESARRQQRDRLDRSAAMNLSMTLPAAGAVLKLHDGKRLICTLEITATGLRYIPANAKKVPQRELPYTAILALCQTGLLG